LKISVHSKDIQHSDQDSNPGPVNYGTGMLTVADT